MKNYKEMSLEEMRKDWFEVCEDIGMDGLNHDEFFECFYDEVDFWNRQDQVHLYEFIINQIFTDDENNTFLKEIIIHQLIYVISNAGKFIYDIIKEEKQNSINTLEKIAKKYEIQLNLERKKLPYEKEIAESIPKIRYSNERNKNMNKNKNYVEDFLCKTCGNQDFRLITKSGPNMLYWDFCDKFVAVVNKNVVDDWKSLQKNKNTEKKRKEEEKKINKALDKDLIDALRQGGNFKFLVIVDHEYTKPRVCYRGDSYEDTRRYDTIEFKPGMIDDFETKKELVEYMRKNKVKQVELDGEIVWKANTPKSFPIQFMSYWYNNN